MSEEALPGVSLQARCRQGFTLSHGMALSHKKSCITAAWKTLWHNLRWKKHLTESIWWQTFMERLTPSSHIKMRKIRALSSYLEPKNQRLPADVGAQMPAQCSSQQKWCEITYGCWAGPSPSAQGMSGMHWRGINVGGDVTCSTWSHFRKQLWGSFCALIAIHIWINSTFLVPGHRECTGDSLGMLWMLAMPMSCKTWSTHKQR